MKKAAFILGAGNLDKIYPAPVRAEVDKICQVVAEMTPDEMTARAAELREVEILFSGWGAPKLHEENLALLPRLGAVFYGAGSLKGLVTDAFWARSIPVCSAWAANGVPVAEFSLAHIILGLKQAHRASTWMRRERRKIQPPHFELAGAFGSTVSLISLGLIGRKVAILLKHLDVKVLAYDPFLPPAEAAALGVELVTLPEAFARARVVSLHTPWLPETEGLITGDLLRLLPPGACFINTARGAVVQEAEMIEVLREREDLTAVLDVTWPEPPSPDSPLFDLPNVVLTPHLAGSVNGECARMGQYMVDECRCWLTGKPMQYQVSREAFLRMA